MSRLLQILIWSENALMALLLTAMILIAASQIILRNFFDYGIAWSDPLLRIMMLWLGLFGAMLASREHNHISIDVLSRFLPKAGQRIASLITHLFSSFICGIISYYSWQFVMSEKAADIIAFETIPAWLCEIIIPISFGVMSLRFTGRCLIDLTGHDIFPVSSSTNDSA
ncbi:MAG: TRAP transporter small permease [Gammaproteobacteria bacterium]|nr:TRAP transporter small permease [Gammaproteobacteria bacterium]